MEDQESNLVRSLLTGLDYKQKQQLIKAFRDPAVGRGVVDLMQIPKLRSLINELDDLVDAYEQRGWRDIDGDEASHVKEFQETYLRLHRRIVDYFCRLSYGDFCSSDLDRYSEIQERIILENRLIERRKAIQGMWDFYHQVTALPNRIRQLPAFNLQRAKEYGRALVVKKTNQSGEVTEKIMEDVLDDDDSEPGYLHGKFFLAKLFIEQQPKRIDNLTRRVDADERALVKATSKERQALIGFKRNQAPKYCTPNYNVTYVQWCAQFGDKIKLPEQVIRLILEIQDGRDR